MMSETNHPTTNRALPDQGTATRDNSYPVPQPINRHERRKLAGEMRRKERRSFRDDRRDQAELRALR